MTLTDGRSGAVAPEELETQDIIAADAAAAQRYGPLRIAPFLTDEQRELLRRTFYKHLDDDQAKIFFEMIERYRLDPFLKQIWPSIRQTKDDEGVKHPTLVPITTLQSFRLIGDRSGKLEYENPVEWCDAEGNWSAVWLHHPKPPYAARGTIKRTDRTQPQVTVCLWEQFCQKNFDRNGKEIPNRFWARMGSHMLGKCSLAGSYRGAFPNLASGLFIGDELGEELDPESEAAIEAEMTRRAAADKEYWDKERAKGNLPVNDVPPPPSDKNGKKKKAASPPPAAPTPMAPETLTQASEPPATPPAPLVSVHPQTALPEVQSAPEPAWKGFVINRIKSLAGRTVGSLKENEMRAIRGQWIGKIQDRWATLDSDMKAHYGALMQRIEYDDAAQAAEAEAAASMSEEAKRAAVDAEIGDLQLPFPT